VPAQAPARPLVSGFDDWESRPGQGDAARHGDSRGSDARLTAWVRGRVQGVGFRWWVRSVALELDLLGMAENLADGRVKIIAEGHRDSCLTLLARLEAPGAPGQVLQVTYRWDEARGGLTGFSER
jgi:acylphosphatase